MSLREAYDNRRNRKHPCDVEGCVTNHRKPRTGKQSHEVVEVCRFD